MELVLAVFSGVLTAAGVYRVLRARSFDVVIGLALLSYAINIAIFLTGRISIAKPPIIGAMAPILANYSDPLPQALVLTAIVIGFAMTALLLAIAVAARLQSGTDHVDGPTADD